ncbi:MAG: HesA/MoeB/ThiF family protein [Candidatus Nealsonbacteria bacterium]|nr:HesA/MoeB/ThiF family protein [Candidatus Nealsonbacteria bacterium]
MAFSQLTPEELLRYDRQLGPGVLGTEGQLRLKNATALVTRTGGMGGPASLALVMGGVGRVIIAHGGKLISPDLNRQVLGCEAGVDKPRMPRFADYLRSMNRHVEVEGIDHEPDDDEATELATRSDVILSCPPGFEERMRLNRVAVAASVPLIDAAQWGMAGTLIVVKPGETACLRCVYPEDPPFEELFPVVGAISAAIGALAALEAIKILSRTGSPMFGKLLMIDAFQSQTSTVTLRRRPDCPCCGSGARE